MSDKFKRRTKDRMAEHRKRAAKHDQALDYDLGDLRTIVQAAIDSGACPFCRRRLTETNFGIDHAQPVCRQGTFELANLTVCCMSCNSAKGPLTTDEFTALVALLSTWPDPARINTLARLKAGARSAPFPKVKSADGRDRHPPTRP